ncbi:hypothetical protein ANME2D_02025 [Candidatus Methanoperedens nitroreducens]|uniref:Uncharacterized protein n=1 Tax=Candidatus Methanoperedens nitratireducens TaxID=1392998 RepID=A0A062V5Y0_9EURY|nr:hypothetical protein [Candidatus Methanoperedens nitroreducens]KCZ71968.1 hypothetical protein ANME2D_02025 [Candidatus Methanoperedens nitroreducens]MDJ1422055.1 hypothetical protein [Candidatus Methanoperedens sp.]
MIIDFSLFLSGILGFLVLYIVLIRLSARMGEGMGLPRYYLLYYVAILALILTIPAGWSIHYAKEESLEDVLFTLLIIGNAIVIAASFKYWWWLKDEFW